MSETEETTPTRLELEEADVYSQYFLHSPTEIAFVLRAAMQKGCLMTVYFDLGQSFFLSSLLNVSPQGIVLDYGSHEETNARALKSTRLICTISVDRIKVQFALNGLSRIDYENQPAFFSPLPESLLRLQRREHFRIATPVIHPVMCDIPQGDEAAPGALLRYPLLDISTGGLGLIVSATEIRQPFSHDTIFRDCVLVLPENGPVKVNLNVRTVLEMTARFGKRNFRVGCEFVDASRSLPNIVQRYILSLERERKARLSGLE
jgi:c-di-GMP-binding flagellar brake protein YcgR